MKAWGLKPTAPEQKAQTLIRFFAGRLVGIAIENLVLKPVFWFAFPPSVNHDVVQGRCGIAHDQRP